MAIFRTDALSGLKIDKATENLIIWNVIAALATLAVGGLLGPRSYVPWLGWLSFALMLAGGAVINVIVLMGGADVMFTSYVPLKGDPLYYLGVILFAVGALLGFIVFFINILLSKRDGGYKRTLPLGAFGMLAASIIAVLTLGHGAAIMVPTWLWSMDLIGTIDPAAYRLVFWGLGHSSQQINVSAMVAVWYMSSALIIR